MIAWMPGETAPRETDCSGCPRNTGTAHIATRLTCCRDYVMVVSSNARSSTQSTEPPRNRHERRSLARRTGG